jgi:hypothetical protein
VRPLAAVCLASAAALADSVAFVDGGETAGHLASATPEEAVLVEGGENRTVPTRRLVEASWTATAEAPAGPINLHLDNGDALRGTVRGEADSLVLDGAGVAGLRVPLARVKAVCFGRLMGGVQERYGEALEEEMRRGRDAIIVEKGTKPFVVAGRILSFDEQTLVVLVGDERRELARHRVYGFARAVEAPEPPPDDGLRVRVHLQGGGRVTLPLESITGDAVAGGGARVDRAYVTRVEFRGGHFAHLSDFEPIGTEEVALFGKAPRWRRDGMVHGGPLRLSGATFGRGLGVQAHSRIEFALGRRWDSFFARCGIDDAAGAEGEALFRVLGDGKVLHEVRRRRGEEPAKVVVDARGVERLVLECQPLDSYESDFCDWAEARVFRG